MARIRKEEDWLVTNFHLATNEGVMIIETLRTGVLPHKFQLEAIKRDSPNKLIFKKGWDVALFCLTPFLDLKRRNVVEVIKNFSNKKQKIFPMNQCQK